MGINIDLRIARHGAVVLFLGMATGFFISAFRNHGMGNAAHLTGLIGGYGLIVLGLLWPRLKLSRPWFQAGAWITIVSMYLNWLGLVVQIRGAALWSRVGGILLAVAAILSLLSVGIVLVGLRKIPSGA